MGRRAKIDDLDLMIMDHWVPGRRQILGIMLPDKLEPKERIGKLNCTLGVVKEMHDGSGAPQFKQHWPQFRSPDGILIQRAFLKLGYRQRRIMDMRYTWHLPRYPFKMRSENLRMSPATFFIEIGMLKARLRGFIEGAGGFNESGGIPLEVQYQELA